MQEKLYNFDDIVQWNYPTNIIFGNDASFKLSENLTRLSLKNPLIVTDDNLLNQDFMQQIFKLLDKDNFKYSIYSSIKPNPTKKCVLDGVEKFNVDANDCVIAIGGGSPLDVGKTVAFFAKQSGNLFDYEDIGNNYTKADSSKIAKIISIPTAAGTGSEVGRCSVILDEDLNQKKLIFHPLMLSEIVIADPKLTVALPKKLTAATGIDALIHNMEAFFAKSFHPMADGIAKYAIEMIDNNIVTAYNNPEDLNARGNMLAAAIMGATAFQKGLGAIHSLAHAIGGITNNHHGLLNAILTPYVLVKNRPAIETKINALNHNFESFMSWILDLRNQLDIPHNLSEIGVTVDIAPLVEKSAIIDPTMTTNPLPLNEGDVNSIFNNALIGKI